MTLKTGPWRLAELDAVPKVGRTVFSCFHCGGGSTMGYKLAGLDVLGGVEIDPEMMGIYRRNFNPRLSYLMGVQEFNKMPDAEVPRELLDLDILDGSPPCSVFSTSGDREKGWDKEKKFREGQAEQRLDDLFIHFAATAAKLKPRVVVSENVRGLISGIAKGYVKEIFAAFSAAGYDTQLFLVNSAGMGVPQSRPRVFFISRRRDLGLDPIRLEFNEPIIPLARAIEGCRVEEADRRMTEKTLDHWRRVAPGEPFSSLYPKNRSYFDWHRLHPAKPCRTLTSAGAKMLFHWKEPRRLSIHECLRIQTFPEDYDFMESDPRYVMGMSVPPLMTLRIADAICGQWFASGSATKTAPASTPGARAPARKPSRARRPKS